MAAALRGGGGDWAAPVVTHPDSDGDSPKFFVTQKVNRRPGLPRPTPRSSPFPQPARWAGRLGEGRGEKRADCAKENKRDTETSRDRKHGETERTGG